MWNRLVESRSHRRTVPPYTLPGHLSRVLAAEDPKLIVGADISQAMVDQYNKIVSDHGIPPEEMRAVCVPPHDKLQGTTFDVIVVSGTFVMHFWIVYRPHFAVCICVSSFFFYRPDDDVPCLDIFENGRIAARRGSRS